MNKRQDSQLTMLHRVENHFNSHEPIWSGNVLIVDAKTALTAKRAQIIAAAALQTDTSKGATVDKTRLRKDLENKTLFVSEAMSAFATLNPSHSQLFKTVYIAKSDLLKLREAELLLFVERLHDAVLSVFEYLAPFGITEVIITELMTARTDFYDIMMLPKEMTSNRKDATKAISDLLHQAITLLDGTMDRLVGVFRISEPAFVDIYFKDRKIHPIGTRNRSLEITTVNAADKTPLEGVQVEVVDHHIKRKSSKKGKNWVQNLKDGYYTLSVSRENFISQMVPITVMSGETTQVLIELEEVSKEQSFKE